MRDAYVLTGSFVIGFLALLLSIIEIRLIYTFIKNYQGTEFVPILNDKEQYQLINIKIRNFRSFLMSKEAKSNVHFKQIKNKIFILNACIYFCFMIFGLGVANLYFNR